MAICCPAGQDGKLGTNLKSLNYKCVNVIKLSTFYSTVKPKTCLVRPKVGAANGWRVCHPLGTPCLVLFRTTIVVYCNSIDSVENLKSAKYFRFSKISNFYIFEIRTFIIHTFAITPWDGEHWLKMSGHQL